MLKTHAPSHGAGHTLPVNSGKLLVCKSCSSASFQLSLKKTELEFRLNKTHQILILEKLIRSTGELYYLF